MGDADEEEFYENALDHLDEGADDDNATDSDEDDGQWTLKDLPPSLLLLLGGALALTFSILTFKNGYPLLYWGGFCIGPVLMLVGLNGVFRSIVRAKDR